MSHRRAFLGSMIGGVTGAAVAATGTAATGRVLGANDRIRFGLIGSGSRGKEIFRAALRCHDVEAVAVADVYSRRLDEARAIVPGIATFKDYQALLDDKTIDAVLIATPQHLHALHFVAAIQAGKDVYQEKTMAFNPGHARRMRNALAGSGRVVQMGMQMNSGDGIQKVRELVKSGGLGTVTLLETHHFRNEPYGGWLRKIPSDCDPNHVNWPAFEGEAKHVPFDADRYINWRFFWDYSGGNVFENMVHTLGFWFGALGLSIPRSVTMTGANYLSPRMQVPDTFQVSMSHAEKLFLHLQPRCSATITTVRGMITSSAPRQPSFTFRRIRSASSRKGRRERSVPALTARDTKSLPIGICGIFSIACAAAASRSAPSNSASVPRSLARWRLPPIVAGPPCAGTPARKRFSDASSL